MTRIQRQITVCAGIHVLFALLLAIFIDLRIAGILWKTPPPIVIPFIVLGVVFPILFTIFVLGVLSKRRWLLNSEAIKNKKTLGYYLTITILTLLSMLFVVSFGDITSIRAESLKPLSTVILIMLPVNGFLMTIDANDKKRGLFILFLKTVLMPLTLFLTVFSLYPLMSTAKPIYFYIFGIIIYAPLTLLIVQLRQIHAYCAWLKEKRYQAILVLMLGLVVFPAVGFAQLIVDRENYGRATSYLNENQNEMPSVNVSRLIAAFNNHKTLKNIPLLSAAYEKLVFKEEKLDYVKKIRLSAIFGYDFILFKDGFYMAYSNSRSEIINNDEISSVGVVLDNIVTRTEYDNNFGAYQTWIDLEIINTTDRNQQEYITRFTLPNGSYISDYYLYIDGEKRDGILVDQRAAVMTYDREVRRRVDPGIIYYDDEDTIILKVFPFDAGEVRKTGFSIMHNENFTLNIDGKEVDLKAENTQQTTLDIQGVIFMPAAFKENLKPFGRVPKYYFLADAGINSPYKEHIKRIDDYISKNKITNYRIYDVNYRVSSKADGETTLEGGFNFPLGINEALNDLNENEYPIIIATKDNLHNVLYEKSEVAEKYPESIYFYHLRDDLKIGTYSFINLENELKTKAFVFLNMSGVLQYIESPIINSFLEYDGHLVSDDGKSEIIGTGESSEYVENGFQNAIILFTKTIHNSDAEKQVDLVRDSFYQKIMTPYTAFSVWETELQEKELYALQEDMLQNPQNYPGNLRGDMIDIAYVDFSEPPPILDPRVQVFEKIFVYGDTFLWWTNELYTIDIAISFAVGIVILIMIIRKNRKRI